MLYVLKYINYLETESIKIILIFEISVLSVFDVLNLLTNTILN